MRGRWLATLARSIAPPAAISAGLSSAGSRRGPRDEVGDADPERDEPLFLGRIEHRSVRPASASTFQKRLPGRAKWWPTAAV